LENFIVFFVHEKKYRLPLEILFLAKIGFLPLKNVKIFMRTFLVQDFFQTIAGLVGLFSATPISSIHPMFAL